MLVAIIVTALVLLIAAVAVPGLLALGKYPRRFGWKTKGFDTPAYLWGRQDERRRKSDNDPHP